MSFLANETIVAPTLYVTEVTKATAFKTAVDTLITERDSLMQDKINAKERAAVIRNEIEELKRQLTKTLVKADRDTIKSSITTLEVEQDTVWDAMGIDIVAVIQDRIAELNIPALQVAALTEHNGWFDEIHTYEQALRSAFNETKRELATIRDTNIYKTTNTNLENLERFISERKKV